MSSKSCEHYYLANNSREAGTGTLFFDLHYETRALHISFTDNLSTKFKHKVWLRYIYAFSIHTKRAIVYIIKETWNANTV